MSQLLSIAPNCNNEVLKMCMYIWHLTEVQYVQRCRQKQSACQAGPCAPQKRNVRQGARHAPVHTQGTINRHCQGEDSREDCSRRTNGKHDPTPENAATSIIFTPLMPLLLISQCRAHRPCDYWGRSCVQHVYCTNSEALTNEKWPEKEQV